ncbi:uncharacterized protein LOC114266092 [Camellia sinensis]|uniref:uncharacterized protein LOC114266092 n=1 Tax=Camellia sinensis TaxID=4442 RepID=UPI00103695A7|nr:uncharacterized protein LOC114266092 [Camellia sinensis]
MVLLDILLLIPRIYLSLLSQTPHTHSLTLCVSHETVGNKPKENRRKKERKEWLLLCRIYIILLQLQLQQSFNPKTNHPPPPFNKPPPSPLSLLPESPPLSLLSSPSLNPLLLLLLLIHYGLPKLTNLLLPPPTTPKPQPQPQEEQRNDFYVNLGLAVRTLREDLPFLFSRDLNYHIYRDDITFVDPLNTFAGIENYKLIFWALRFHGRILFHEIGLEVLRIWQPSENVILIRWNLRGIPRVPWEAKGQFQGTSRYKLDRNGKIYEHKVDNLAFNFPRPLKPAASVLDLVRACPASPNPTFLWGPVDDVSSSWLEFYRAVRETLDCQNHLTVHDRLVTCS